MQRAHTVPDLQPIITTIKHESKKRDANVKFHYTNTVANMLITSWRHHFGLQTVITISGQTTASATSQHLLACENVGF